MSGLGEKRTDQEINSFGNRLNMLMREGKLSHEEVQVLMRQFKSFKISMLSDELRTDDFIDEDACLTRKGEIISPMQLEIFSEDDSLQFDDADSSESENVFTHVPTPTTSPTTFEDPATDAIEETYPTVPFDVERHSSKPRPDGKPAKSRRERMIDLRSTVRTLSCMFFARAARGRSYDNERRQIVGPFILRPDGAVPSNKSVLQVKALIEILLQSTDALEKLLKDNQNL